LTLRFRCNTKNPITSSGGERLCKARRLPGPADIVATKKAEGPQLALEPFDGWSIAGYLPQPIAFPGRRSAGENDAYML
jgi:hypothetical protein